eukprot:9500366-Pyramimonas_sp.AAC.1
MARHPASMNNRNRVPQDPCSDDDKSASEKDEEEEPDDMSQCSYEVNIPDPELISDRNPLPDQWCSFYGELFQSNCADFKKPQVPNGAFKIVTLCSGTDAPVCGMQHPTSSLPFRLLLDYLVLIHSPIC